MTTQRNMTFEKFNDGIVAIYEIDDDGNAERETSFLGENSRIQSLL